MEQIAAKLDLDFLALRWSLAADRQQASGPPDAQAVGQQRIIRVARTTSAFEPLLPVREEQTVKRALQ
jgi:hypothetical protein